MTSTHKRSAPAGQSTTTKSLVKAVEFFHLETVSTRDSDAPSAPLTTTPFIT